MSENQKYVVVVDWNRKVLRNLLKRFYVSVG